MNTSASCRRLPRRWYELASYAVFGALRHRRPTARLGYGEFCTYAPQTRYTGFGPMRRQMAKVLAPHLESGYLAGVAFEPSTNQGGRLDWTMVYEPGPRAKAEHLAFTRRSEPAALALEPPPAEAPPPAKPEPTGLERELVEHGVSPSVAADLVRDFPEDRIQAQIEQVDWLRERQPKKVKDLGAYLTTAVRENYAAPAGFESKPQRSARETAARAALEREAAARQAQARAGGRGPDQGVLGGADARRAGAARCRGAGAGRSCRPRGVRDGHGAAGQADALDGPPRGPRPPPARPARHGLTGKASRSPATTFPLRGRGIPSSDRLEAARDDPGRFQDNPGDGLDSQKHRGHPEASPSRAEESRTMPFTAPPTEPSAPLLDVHQVARLLGISPRSVWRFAQSGKMPASVSLGRAQRWRSKDLGDWIAHGCPPGGAGG